MKSKEKKLKFLIYYATGNEYKNTKKRNTNWSNRLPRFWDTG